MVDKITKKSKFGKIFGGLFGGKSKKKKDDMGKSIFESSDPFS